MDPLFRGSIQLIITWLKQHSAGALWHQTFDIFFFFVQLPARKEISGLLMATPCMKVEWRSAITTFGALFVMTSLQGLIVLLFAGSLVLAIQVITAVV